MAPDLTWEGSSVQRTWLVDFLKNPNTLRPALIRRMPKFNVTGEEADVLADYIMTVYQTPEFERDQIDRVEVYRRRGGSRQGSLLRQVCLQLVPYSRSEQGQGLHRSDADPGWLAAECRHGCSIG